jgi:hypothetical protein
MPPGGEQVTAPYSKDQVKAASPDQAHPHDLPDGRGRALPPPRWRVWRVALGQRAARDKPDRANGEPGIREVRGRLNKHLVSERMTGVMPYERDNVPIEPE